ERQDVCAPWLGGAVRRGIVHRPRQVKCRASRRQRTRDRARGIYFVNLQSMDTRVVVDAVMRLYLQLMTAGDKLHTAVLQVRLLERHPDTQSIILEIRSPVGFILVPGRRRAMKGGLEDRMVAGKAVLRPQQLRGDRQRIDSIQAVLKLRLVFGEAQ